MIKGQKIINESETLVNKSYKITDKQIEELKVLKKQTNSKSMKELFSKMISLTQKQVESEINLTSPASFKRTHNKIKPDKPTRSRSKNQSYKFVPERILTGEK